MSEAPPRERAALARTGITMNMIGQKKIAKFGLLRSAEYIGVSILCNMLTKFGKLAVGKHVVSVKQRSSGEPIFPLTIALSGLHPLTKVWVDYEPQPKDTFVIKVNDADIYSLVKEEIDYDPTKTETLEAGLGLNDNGDLVFEMMPWIIEEVADKVESALGMEYLTCLLIT